ncbi:MAG: lambda-exonuclease family protein, partial [Kiritimatiellales bacterium]
MSSIYDIHSVHRSYFRDKGQSHIRHIYCTRPDEALKWFLLGAEKGDNYSQFIMGVTHKLGVGDFPKDLEKAVEWYRLAAEQGQQSAQLELVDAFESGWGRAVCKQEAEHWRIRAAEKNRPRLYVASGEPEYDAGLIFEKARDEKYWEEGYRWLRRSAELGYAEAQNSLGLSYECGDLVEEDLQEAKKWYQRAADQGLTEAFGSLRSVLTDLGEYEEALKQGLIYAKLSSNGDGFSEVGSIYANHLKDGAKAEEFYRLAAESTYCRDMGLYHLGQLYEKGDVVPQDYSKAYAYYNLIPSAKHRDELMERMTRDQIAEGQRLTQHLKDSFGNPSLCVTDASLESSEHADVRDAVPDEGVSVCKEINLKQGTKEWVDWRDTGIGGSDAPTVLGENPWKSASVLLEEKLGKVEPFAGNEATRRGARLEPEARRLYEQFHGVEVEPICLQSTEYPWMLASLDGISADHQHVVEFKCGESVYK